MQALLNHQRPERLAVPAIDSLQSLDATHRQVLTHLEQLRELVGLIEAQGASARTRTQAEEIRDFFGGRAREHHQDEEDLVFPVLLEQGDAELTQHVQRLQQDHGWLEQCWLELSPQLATLAAGYSGCDLDQLRQGVELFAELYQDHIALEEGVVFPAARRVFAARRPSRAPLPA
ncbi:hemerythrin domain-containing protein [Azohydromonas caseinilytica]|uniref:Hemerythrin domain-containing protein n=1 Tax=Azohydromonas caseinilytica TaxID=2728836 RepID=A0A848FCF6_9BURK|nr:hemerythrin domain-containing protein [Azohydromonas caseinilytica]NML16079.1 hemerythrin domain-containing protein [Azohydromonas caseinilytica]